MRKRIFLVLSLRLGSALATAAARCSTSFRKLALLANESKVRSAGSNSCEPRRRDGADGLFWTANGWGISAGPDKSPIFSRYLREQAGQYISARSWNGQVAEW